MNVQRCMLLVIAVMLWTAVPAPAQWVVTPSWGINLAGDAEFRRGGPGVAVDYFGGPRGLGFELDVQWYEHFYKDAKVVGLVESNCGVGPRDQRCVDLNTDAFGVMGNVVAPIRIAGAEKWHPYASAGLGVIRALLTDPSNTVTVTAQNNVAINVGGGVTYSFKPRVGLRGDVRYIRALVDAAKREGFYFKDYGFLRATVGVSFRFPR